MMMLRNAFLSSVLCLTGCVRPLTTIDQWTQTSTCIPSSTLDPNIAGPIHSQLGFPALQSTEAVDAFATQHQIPRASLDFGNSLVIRNQSHARWTGTLTCQQDLAHASGWQLSYLTLCTNETSCRLFLLASGYRMVDGHVELYDDAGRALNLENGLGAYLQKLNDRDLGVNAADIDDEGPTSLEPVSQSELEAYLGQRYFPRPRPTYYSAVVRGQ